MNFIALGIANRHIVDAAKTAKCTFTAFDPLEMYLYISESENGYDRIYNGDPKLEKPVRLKAKEYDFLLPRLSGSLPHKTVILEHLNENLGIYSPQKAEPLRTASNKILTTLQLSQAGIKIPKTIWAKSLAHAKYVIETMMGGLPIVAKTVYGSQGAGVCILETTLSAYTALESFYAIGANLKLQRYVDGGFTDIRAIVVGDKVVTAMERKAAKGDFRANLSKDGSGRKLTLSEEDQQLCINASRAIGLEFSGVDLMKDKDGVSYVIEVNGNPGTGIIDITGVNYFVELIEYCKGQKKRGSEALATHAQAQRSTINDCGKLYTTETKGDVTTVLNHPEVITLRTAYFKTLNPAIIK